MLTPEQLTEIEERCTPGTVVAIHDMILWQREARDLTDGIQELGEVAGVRLGDPIIKSVTERIKNQKVRY